MKFIDLFAGLGGFHLALDRLGHECVFAAESDPALREVYYRNFGIAPAADIRDVSSDDIPRHDILCAGFPCQPFSKAGEQKGFECPQNGDLFDHVCRIIRHHEPPYLILENVPNIRWHNGGGTWQDLVSRLQKLGYHVESERLSPHHFGIPQIRDRVFIVASRHSLRSFAWPRKQFKPKLSVETVLDKNPSDARRISAGVEKCVETWDSFLRRMPSGVSLPKGPLWSMEFGATYPFEEEAPLTLGMQALKKHTGSFGIPLADLTLDEIADNLPSYARQRTGSFPLWKVRFIRANRLFYDSNRRWIDPWMHEVMGFPSSLQKLEWNCRGDPLRIWDNVIQFRASGVRVKRRTTAPSLVAMTMTQVPIIGWERRYMTLRECARLQSMRELAHLPKSDDRAYAALGNAVNVQVVFLIATALIRTERDCGEITSLAAAVNKESTQLTLV